MELYNLVKFIEFIAQVKNKAAQIKDKYKQKISINSDRVGFRIYDKINNTKIYNIIHSDTQGNIYYSNNLKSIYKSAKHFSFIAFDIVHKTFTIIGSNFKKEYILDENDNSLVEQVLNNKFENIIVVNKNYFANRFDYLINNLQFIKDNLNVIIELYLNYKNSIMDYLSKTKIILNCLIDVSQKFEINQMDNINDNYQLLFEHLLFYIIYPSVDLETRSKLNESIKNLQQDINDLLINYDLQNYIQFIDFEISPANYSKLTSLSIVTYAIYFENFIDILLFSEFTDSIDKI